MVVLLCFLFWTSGQGNLQTFVGDFKMQDVKSADWSRNVAPFWGEVRNVINQRPHISIGLRL